MVWFLAVVKANKNNLGNEGGMEERALSQSHPSSYRKDDHSRPQVWGGAPQTLTTCAESGYVARVETCRSIVYCLFTIISHRRDPQGRSQIK